MVGLCSSISTDAAMVYQNLELAQLRLTCDRSIIAS